MEKLTPFRSSVKTHALPAQQKIYELLRSGLMKSGVDFEEMEQLHRESMAEFAEESKKALAKTLQHSASLAPAVNRNLKDLQANLKELKNFTAASPSVNLTLLDTATSVTASDVSLSATNVAPQNNWAQFDYKTRETNTVTVDFSYEWTNASDVYVVVNVIGFIAFNGVLVASTDGSVWPWVSQHCHDSISAVLKVTTLATGGSMESGDLSGPTLDADSGGNWFAGNPGVYESATVFRGLPPTYNAVTIPPDSALQVDVIGQFGADIERGYGEFNFEGDGRQVSSLGVIISIVS